MTKTAGKLEFTTGRAVTVCAKAGIERKNGHKQLCISSNFQ